MSENTKENSAGPAWSRYCDSTPGPQDCEPMPCWPWSRLTQTPAAEPLSDAAPSGEVGAMGGRVQLLGGPAAGGEPELGVALDPQSADLRPTDVRPGAVLLRPDIRGLHSIDSRLPAADCRRRPGVRIRFARPAAEPPHTVGGRQSEEDAEPGQRHRPVAVGGHGDGELEAVAIRGPAVDRDRAELPGRRGHSGAYGQRLAVHVHCVQAVPHTVQTERAPQRAVADVALPGGVVVVVGGRPPDVQTQPGPTGPTVVPSDGNRRAASGN